MFKQLRGPERAFKIGQWIVALLFAYFLIEIGAAVIADLPQVSSAPERSSFVDQPALNRLHTQMQGDRDKIAQLDQERHHLDAQLGQQQTHYQQEQASFETWRDTRRTTGKSDQDAEVVARARRLDGLLAAQQATQQEIQRISEIRQRHVLAIAPLEAQAQALEYKADQDFFEASRRALLKVFFIRLAFVLPLLISALWLFRRHRQSAQWPFVWGYILFALFAFFFELVPYLPSFGGYIRYGVGALLTFWGGRLLINALQRYLERKQQEQAAPEEARKQDIRYERALESIAKGQCPGCERPFVNAQGVELNYCMHCGLRIHHACSRCGLRHNAFFPFCPACGQRSGEHSTETPAETPTAAPTKADTPPQTLAPPQQNQ